MGTKTMGIKIISMNQKCIWTDKYHIDLVGLLVEPVTSQLNMWSNEWLNQFE